MVGYNAEVRTENRGTVPILSRLQMPALSTWLPLVVGTAWLLACILVGIHVMRGPESTPARFSGAAPLVSAKSHRSAYGGDAYTGIQNAASDTEHAVADTANAVTEVVIAVNEWAVGQLVQEAANTSKHLFFALGFLIIAAGAGPFLLVLSKKFTPPPRGLPDEYPVLPRRDRQLY